MKLSTIYRLAAATAIAVSGVALMAINGPASAATRQASVNYCLQYGHGGSDCSFTSKAQCEATASGQNAECFRNYYGKEGETLHW
jgi:hypothetical protein